EIFALPGDCRLVEREGALAVTEGPGVVHTPARSVRAREELMQHLVEDDELHEESRNLGMVQRRMDADLPGLVVVDAEADRLPSTAAGRASPADGGPHSILEEAIVQGVADLLQMEELALGGEALIGCVAFLTDARLLSLDELVQDPAGPGPPTAGVVGH